MGQEVENVKWRPIREEELEMVLNWRMLPEITKYMYTDPQLTMDIQKAWYQRIQSEKENRSFIIEVNGIPAGIMNVTDIDRKNQRCSWGYYVAVKEIRSLELAMLLEWNLYDYAFEQLGMHKVTGEIFSFNKEVLRIHRMCGSVTEGELKHHIFKNGSYYDVTVTGILKENWEKIKPRFHYKRVEIQEYCL